MCRFLVANLVFSVRKRSCGSSFSWLEEGTEGWSPEVTGVSKQLHPSSDRGVKHLEQTGKGKQDGKDTG